jgi:hypothetical protein
MRRLAGVLTLALVAACGPAAHAQEPTPIPEGETDAPTFTGAPATQQPVRVPPLSPQHPFMTRNPWSNIHNDAYMSDAYEGPGPLGRGTTRTSTFKVRECASVTFDSRGRIVTICVGLDRPVLTLMDPTTLRTIASMDLPPRTPRPGAGATNDFSGGGYFYLDERDRAVLATTDRRLLVVEVGEAGFKLVRDVSLTGAVPQGDGIVSTLPDWSGRIWFVTQSGVVGTVSADDSVRHLPLGERITDSFSVDETGGVFIVSNGALYRFDAGPDGGPVVSWREVYDNSGVQKPGQVSPGSGTTPTLMDGGLVAIADNAEHMQIAVYRRGRDVSGPRLVCEQPVFERGRGATDNSLIAAGSSIVVENNFGYSGLAATQNGRSTEPGIERVDLDPATGTCRSVWRSQERSPSVVPKLSLANGLVYAYVKEPAENGDDLWYFTALDFRTGKTAYKVLAGEGLGYNNNYAPVTLGPDGSAYVGVLGGLVRLADREPPPGARPAAVVPASATARDGGGRCLPRRAAVTSRGIGSIRLGASAGELVNAGGLPVRRAVHFCVAGGGRVSAALDARDRAVLVISTARGHTARRVGARTATTRFRRAFGNRRRVARGVFRSGRHVAHVRARRLTWIGIAATTRAATLRAAARAVGR